MLTWPLIQFMSDVHTILYYKNTLHPTRAFIFSVLQTYNVMANFTITMIHFTIKFYLL